MANFLGTVLVSAPVTAALLAVVTWLARNWIGERIKGAIQHEYDREIESHKSQLKVQHERSLEELRSELGEVSAERNARRDYEYEARKKLYENYEPLLFQLIEHSENAYYRVLSLARSVRLGNLKPDGGWLSQPGYYMRSTIYKLLAPMALFKVIQNSLTFVDLSVDPRIAANYTLAKLLSLTFTCEFELSELDPVIAYLPYAEDANDRRNEDPQQFWRQGIPLGCLDNVLHDCMLTEGQPARLRTFGDFERKIDALTEDDQHHDITLFFEMFENFHPQNRPVLWRVLLTQAHLHRLLIKRVGSKSDAPYDEIGDSLQMPSEERTKFYWSDTNSSPASDAAEPFDVAVAFLQESVNKFRVVG